ILADRVGAAVVERRLPLPVRERTEAFAELAVEAEHGALGVDALVERTRSELLQAAAVAGDVGAERVVQAVGRDRRAVEVREQRLLGELLLGPAVLVAALEEQARVLREVLM